MSDPIAFSLPGAPTAWQRPRATARIHWANGKPRAIITLFTAKEVREAEARLSGLARAYMAQQVRPGGRNAPREPFDGPVRMMIVAVYAVPKSWPKRLQELIASGQTVYHTSKPDTDNLTKFVGDALNGIAYQDDCQVAELVVRKRYGSPARTDITITPLASAGMTPADRRRAPEPPRLPLDKGSPRPLDASPRLL